jgi:maleylacetate reductase
LQSFTYIAHPARVVFGPGMLSTLPDEVRALGGARALVLCTPGQRDRAEQVADLLGPLCAGLHDGARMHVPVQSVHEARDRAVAMGADCILAVGGGSTIGLAKGLARAIELPILAVPTTYAGSEMTPIYGITQGGLKTTGKDARVLPRTVIYDPDLTAALPVPLSVVSGMNAMAHAAEGLYARDCNPVMALMAEEGLRAMATGLRALGGDGAGPQARSDCLYGAWLCGTVLGHVGMALHHKLCHTLGGSFDLPHAQTHTIVLPHALAYNAAAAPQAMARIARAIGARSAPLGLFDLGRQLGAPMALRDLGLDEGDLDRACAIAMANPYWNPRPLDPAALRALLQRAWAGEPPRV